jgi:hypothetical protein
MVKRDHIQCYTNLGIDEKLRCNRNMSVQINNRCSKRISFESQRLKPGFGHLRGLNSI